MDAVTAEELEAAAACLARARYAIALTGAGLSVESGIPPFRGPGGLWTRYGEPPMDGFQRFLRDPKGAWEERLNPTGPMRELWATLARARPNPGHHALVELERLGVLKAVITQNVDDLHRAAGSVNLLEIHGNATLVRCFEESERADCVLVAGTSATVHPAAQLPVTVHERGGDVIEVNPNETDLSPLARHSLRAPAGEVLPRLAERVRARL